MNTYINIYIHCEYAYHPAPPPGRISLKTTKPRNLDVRIHATKSRPPRISAKKGDAIHIGLGLNRCLQLAAGEGLATKTSQNIENPDMFGSDRLYNGFNHFQYKFDAQKQKMHLNTSPPSFQGPQGREKRFRGPGPENKVYGLRTKFTIIYTSITI